MSSTQRWPVAVGPVIEQAGTPVVANARTVNFQSGATVTDAGSGVAAVAVSGGGGGGGYPDAAPGSPSVNDDEFTTDPLDPKWTLVTDSGLAPTPNLRGTWLMQDGDSANPYLIRQALGVGVTAPAGTKIWVVCKMAYGGWLNNLIRLDMTVQDNHTAYSSGNFLIVGMASDGAQVKAAIYDGSDHGTNDIDPTIDAVIWHIQRSANNKLIVRISSGAGNAFRVLYEAAWAHDITDVYLRLLANTSSTAQPSRLGFDWIRFNDPAFEMPDPT